MLRKIISLGVLGGLFFSLAMAQVPEGKYRYTISGLTNFSRGGSKGVIGYSATSGRIVVAVGQNPAVLVGINPSSGQVVWKKAIDFSSYTNEQVVDMVIVGSYAFVVGHANWSSTDRDIFVLKVSTSTGSIVSYALVGSTDDEVAYAIYAYSSTSPVIITGYRFGTGSFALKLSSTFSTVNWARQYTVSGNSAWLYGLIYKDAATARLFGRAGTSGVYISINPSNGSPYYSAQYSGVNSLYKGISSDSIYVAGRVNGENAILKLGWGGQYVDNWTVSGSASGISPRVRMINSTQFLYVNGYDIMYAYASGNYLYDYWTASWDAVDAAVTTSQFVILENDLSSASYFDLIFIDRSTSSTGYQVTGCTASSLSNNWPSVSVSYPTVTSTDITSSFSVYSASLLSTTFSVSISSVCGGQPDLTVSSVSVSASGNNVSGSATITNQGTSSASSIQVCFYASTNTTITTADCQLYCTTISSLGAGASTTVTLPSTDLCNVGCISSGSTYYIGAIVDPNNTISESNESNNSNYDAFPTVTASCNPDLTVSTVSVSASGNNVSGTATITNQGSASATSVQVCFYASTNTTITTSDCQLYCTTISSLAAGGSTTVTLPTTDLCNIGCISSGSTYYIGAIVDPNNTITESSETNNSNYDAFPTVTPNCGGGGGGGQPDLTIPSVSITASGNNVSGSATVSNQGSSSASSVQVCFYASTDATITTADCQLYCTTVSSLAAGGSTTVTLPSTDLCNFGCITSGSTYYIGAIVDPGNFVSESNEVNNSNYDSWTTVTPNCGGGGGGGQPDLSVPSVSITASGNNVSGSATISNQGSSSASSIQVCFYASTDGNITTSDCQLYCTTVSSLAAGGTTTVNLPSTDLCNIGCIASGSTYYVGVIVDPGNSIVESDETNNNNYDSWTTVTPNCGGGGGGGSQPDLIVSNVSANVSGNNVFGSANIVNQGSSSASSIQVCFYASTDVNITTADCQLHCTTVSSLSAGGSATVTLPTIDLCNFGCITSGSTYYIGAIVDPVNNIAESDETNNSNYAASPTITPNCGGGGGGGQPDLAITDISVSVVGNNVSGTAVIENLGTSLSPSAQVCFYASTNTIITTADCQLYCTNVGSLNSGGSTTVSLPSIDLCNTGCVTSGGSYYIGAIVDPSNAVAESNENNNAAYASWPTASPNCAPACSSCPDYDFVITLTPTWQTHNNTISEGGCKIYRFYANAGDTVHFSTCSGNSPGTATFDSYLELYDDACSMIATNDDNCSIGVGLSYLNFVVPDSGFYYLKVRAKNPNSAGMYTLAYRVGVPSTPTGIAQTVNDELNVNMFVSGDWLHVNVLSAFNEPSYLEMTDLTGRTLMIQEIWDNSVAIWLGDLPAGIYIVKLVLNDKVFTRRIIISE